MSAMVLFQTKLRRKLLVYSFTHPSGSYYVRELAVLINEDPGNLSRELKKLEAEGLFTFYSRGGAKFYKLNSRYPLFKELKKIIFKTEGIEGSLRHLAALHKGIISAFIYGSYAKNREKKTSDVDLVIVGEFQQQEMSRQIRDLEAKLGREINFISYTKEEFEKARKTKGEFLNIILKDEIIILKNHLDVRKAD